MSKHTDKYLFFLLLYITINMSSNKNYTVIASSRIKEGERFM